jgi:hypothetical protein
VAYSIPMMPLMADLFTGGDFTMPARATVTANLAWGRRVNVATSGGTGDLFAGQAFMTLLVAAGSDVRGPQNAGGADGVECPAGSGRQYVVIFVDDLGKGFPNEHRGAILQPIGAWPTPIP